VKKLGRNQWIAIVAGLLVFVASYMLVWTERVNGSEWLAFAQWFLPTWLGVTLGGSALVKATAKAPAVPTP
jgi:hypothetical protein